MGDSGNHLTATAGSEVSKNGCSDLASYVSESVAVVEQKRSTAVVEPQELYDFFEGEDLGLPLAPLACARCLSLAIKAVLRASS